MQPRFSILEDWLTWLETLHPQAIDLGLSRVFEVVRRLELINVGRYPQSGKLNTPNVEVFTIAGTNGKGSCVKTLEQSLLLQGHHVATYTSPHIHHYCERIQINGEPVSESVVCDAFAAIDHARGDISLTYFEFGTLAALWIFVQQKIPKVILEVGLGGRLDAVNIIDADVAVVTSIALDHEEWLGSDLEQIALEKLGVTRPDNTVVIAEGSPLKSLVSFAQEHDNCYLNGRDFSVSQELSQAQWKSLSEEFYLPVCTLPIASVVAGLQALSVRGYSITQDHINELLPTLTLMGRYQCIEAMGKHWIFDVAHNVAAVTLLAQRLQALDNNGKTLALFAAMNDKDVSQIIEAVKESIDHWFIGDLLGNARAMTATAIGEALDSYGLPYLKQESLEAAFYRALDQATEHDRIVVFGSFFTVAGIQQLIDGEKIGTA